jgi:hypothetical protein
MADKEPFASFTTTAAQIAEQMTKETQGAMENYFGWLQKAMSTYPWSNTNLNTILLSNALKNVTATFAFVQKLSQAKNFQDIIKIQTEFMETQMNSFNKTCIRQQRHFTIARGRHDSGNRPTRDLAISLRMHSSFDFIDDGGK